MQRLTSNKMKSSSENCFVCGCFSPFDLVTTNTKLLCLYLCRNSLSLPDDGLFNLPMCSKCVLHNLFFKYLSLKSKGN